MPVHNGYTTTSEIVAKGAGSNSQIIANTVAQWSSVNRVKLNTDKCKELKISFAKNKAQLTSIVVDNKELECVDSAKLLDVMIANNLTWNEHIDQVIKKASKHMYLQLKRAMVPRNEIILFYTSCIWSVLTYASPVFFLPMSLKKDLERIEKRALATCVICLGLSYTDALELSTSIVNDATHHLHSMLQFRGPLRYELHQKRWFVVPKCKTEVFKNSFLIKAVL